MNNVLKKKKKNAVLYPNKIAISINNESISFHELMLQSKKLASRVKGLGISYNGIIVFVNRGIKSIILFMASLYSGSFYIPIDPDMPVEKIQSIFDDCNPNVILGEECNRGLFDSLNSSGTFLTDGDSANHSCELPLIDDNSPLYMVYTSGSTGKPKGVVKSHRAYIDFIEEYTNTFHFESDEIIGNQTPLFFDASAKDIYLMLKTGATLDIIPTEKFAMPTELIDYMNEKRISFISWVPTALSFVSQVRTFSFITPRYLKRVFFVGEVMPTKVLNYWRKFLPEVQFVNLYGQSEVAGINCYYEVTGTFANDDSLPIGLPLSNCKIYLFDNGFEIDQPRRIGEIYVAGNSLATMYFNDIKKTESSFVFLNIENEKVRAFKTGDLAYYDDNGLLNFASRSDYQIKHLGHRIELGEIDLKKYNDVVVYTIQKSNK